MAELAKALNINEDGILEVMNLYARIDLHSHDEPFSADNCRPRRTRTSSTIWQQSFALPIEDKHRAVRCAGQADGAFQKRLIYLLFFKDLTQSEVAVEMGLTQKKVSRESIKALGRLKDVMGKKVF